MVEYILVFAMMLIVASALSVFIMYAQRDTVRTSTFVSSDYP